MHTNVSRRERTDSRRRQLPTPKARRAITRDTRHYPGFRPIPTPIACPRSTLSAALPELTGEVRAPVVDSGSDRSVIVKCCATSELHRGRLARSSWRGHRTRYPPHGNDFCGVESETNVVIFGDAVHPRLDAVEVGLLGNRQIVPYSALTAVYGDSLAGIRTEPEPACLRPGNGDAGSHRRDDERANQPATGCPWIQCSLVGAGLIDDHADSPSKSPTAACAPPTERSR